MGSGFRGLVVDDGREEPVELRWRDVDRVEFMAPPAGTRPGAGSRIHGTLRTRDGGEFTGYVAWDVDEILSTDVLDGEEDGRDVEIPFHGIAAIERAGSSGARVVLSGGEELLLRGSNDVDSGNRGISVSDPGLGQVTVGWDDFEELVLHEPAEAAGGYGAFDGGYRLYGSVETEDGEVLEGYLRWDNDEAWSWEILDGRLGDVELDVELGLVAAVRRLGGWGAEVTLRDGRAFELTGSNDVDEGNKGIFLTSGEGETVLVRWRDLREVKLWQP